AAAPADQRARPQAAQRDNGGYRVAALGCARGRCGTFCRQAADCRARPGCAAQWWRYVLPRLLDRRLELRYLFLRCWLLLLRLLLREWRDRRRRIAPKGPFIRA